MKRIDLRSDTVTCPSDAMRDAIARAEVGDDVYGEDPTVHHLQQVAAERLGKEAALFVPSGTMANQISLRAHTQPGDGVVIGRDVHVYLYEAGAAAALSGVQFDIVGPDGFFDADDVRSAVHPHDAHLTPTRLVCVENTHNRSGGRVFPFEQLRRVTGAAREARLLLHMDGARLFNAEIATGIQACDWAEPFDSVAFCLSKGLGCPAGSLVCGSRAFVERAHRFRKMFGGAMRQAGVLAAAGVHALEHGIKRLADDHENAKRLARGLEGIPGVVLRADPETNMVLFSVPDVARFVRETRRRELLINPISPNALRAVTHLGVSGDDIDDATERVREALGA